MTATTPLTWTELLATEDLVIHIEPGPDGQIGMSLSRDGHIADVIASPQPGGNGYEWLTELWIAGEITGVLRTTGLSPAGTYGTAEAALLDGATEALRNFDQLDAAGEPSDEDIPDSYLTERTW